MFVNMAHGGNRAQKRSQFNMPSLTAASFRFGLYQELKGRKYICIAIQNNYSIKTSNFLIAYIAIIFVFQQPDFIFMTTHFLFHLTESLTVS